MSENSRQSRIAPLPHRLLPLWQVYQFWVGVISTIVLSISGLIAVYYFCLPSIGIYPGVIGSNINPMLSEFVFKNEGHITLVNNSILCHLNTANAQNVNMENNTIITPGRRMSQIIDVLTAGQAATRECQSAFPIYLIFPCTIYITLRSKWPGIWPIFSWTSDAQFVSIRDASGHMHFVPDTR